jgi:hypothetical protein
MKEFNVDFTSKAHQTDSLVLDLSYKSLVVGVLSRNKLSDKIFSVGLSDSVRLTVKNVSEIIMIFLFSVSDFDIGQHNHS